MSAYEKCQTNNDLYKKHAARCEKDIRSVCPSKLSKRELEDLYYSLLENNLEMKKTINAQNEKNRILSTKVQRMTAQTKNYLDTKECCAAGKTIVNEQKAVITDLMKANEAMADRVRRLSTQLCTAKQFLKQNPNARHCYKCYVNATTSVKNLSTTSLQNKISDVNLKSLATSARSADRGPPTKRTAETNTSEKDVENVKVDAEKVCNENRCRSTMEDFKQKIEELEEELAKTHEEYSSRMTQLENQVSLLQAAGLRARSELSARAGDDARGAGGRSNKGADKAAEMETLLTIEKNKVAELEMRLKAAEVSQQVAKAIEGHQSAVNRLEQKQLRQTSIQQYSVSSNLALEDVSPRRIPATTTHKRSNELTVPEDKLSKSDDSGFADHRRDSLCDEKQYIDKTNQELIKKLGEMQAQLDALKLSSDKRSNTESDASSYRKTSNIYDKDWDDVRKTKQPDMIPKRPQISILEPETMSPKQTNSAQADITKEYSNISKLERNDQDTNASSLQNAKRELDNSDTKQPNETNVSTHKDHKSSGCCGRGGNKDNSDIYSPKSKDIAIDKDVDNASDSKSKRLSQVIFQSGMDNNRQSQEINPKNLKYNGPEESNSTRNSILQNSKSSARKADDHNYQQIPGPLPVNSETASSKRSVLSNKALAANWKKARNYGKRRSNDDAHDKNKIDEIGKTAHVTKDVNKTQDTTNSDGENSYSNGSKDLKHDDDKEVTNDEKNRRSVTHAQSSEGSKTAQQETTDDSIQEKQLQRKVKELGTPSGHLKTMKNGLKISRDRLEPKTFSLDKRPGSQGTSQDLDRIDEFDICLHHATVCTCPEKPSPSMSVFRSCSGTMTVASVSTKSRFRRCTCSERPPRSSCGSVLRDAPIGTSTPKPQNKAATTISPQTYTVDPDGKRSSATSPDNTDNEISVMSDLPTEREAATPRDILSPGEHKTAATTTTESYSIPNEMTLSEGEVPTGKYPGRRTSKSVGEAPSNDYPMKDNSIGEHKSSSDKMEAALHAISRELARCRWLLQSQRPREQWQCNAATGPDCACDSMTLRRTRGMARIDGIDVPTCLFIVHIAAVVLADEAVIRSRDARFILTWKFFVNDSTVTPMCVGRVLNLHFSTQYYVEMTRDVVNYFSNEDMLIMMWEVGSSGKPFATCALPLEQVLVNANKRIDFSLPLRAGPYLMEMTPNILNDSIGVLDAWCMLHCDRINLPVANRTAEENNGELTNPLDSEQPKESTNTIIQDQQRQGNHSMNLTAGKRTPSALNENLRLSQPPSCDERVLQITVLWLTLHGNCSALLDNDARRLYVAYTFLGRDEAELETPTSLPKPKHATEKCIFNFRKSFNLTDKDMQVLEHMVNCRSQGRSCHNTKNCIVFTIVSEPPEDPLGLENCEDIGFAFLYLGDLLVYSLGDSLTEMLPVYAVRAPGVVCGDLSVQVDGLYVLRALQENGPDK